MAIFITPQVMIQITYQSNDYHFISSHDKKELFTSCGRVVFHKQAENVKTELTVNVKAKDVCKKCQGGMKVT